MNRQSACTASFNEGMVALFAVPRSVVVERHAAHKRASAQNPKRRGPKPKGGRASRVPAGADQKTSR
jgi:hypothetical protein